MTYEEFEKEFYKSYYPSIKSVHQSLRLGQAYMSFLSIKKKYLYTTITYLKTDIDPFYNDAKLDKCKEWVKNVW